MADKIKVAISADFLTAFARLPRQIQGKVTEFLNRFRNDPNSPGINYERINGCADRKICSVRIDNTYRGIVVRQEESGVYLLLWVDHHDEAYQWAIRKRCEVNPQTGALQVYDVQIIEEKAVVPEKEPLLSKVSDADLLKLGVPEAQIPYVRTFTDADAFYAAEKSFSPDTYEMLTWLIEGFPVEEVLEMMEANHTDSSTEDIAAALDRPETQKSFVIVEGEDELRRIMAEPLEKWRVFLHPTQRKLVKRNYSGPARVLGGAGTGKTVVAMHRAKVLASRLSGKERVLFTTYTANLASDIRDNLRKICSTDELRRIEVINLDAWVGRYLKEAGFDAEIIYGEAIEKLWEDAILESCTDTGFTADFFEEEWNRVAISQEALTLPKYAKATRTGRGTRLDRKKRIEIWKVFECYQNLMNERHVRDINTAMYECCKLLEGSGIRETYPHIVVDEGQDLSDNAYRLLRCLAGEEHQNDIFIVGDAHQRIYKNKPVLSKCGINVRGRSSLLKVNYRTTEEIRKYAIALLNGISFDDLDESTDDGDNCRSLTHGRKPSISNFKDANGEFEFILAEIRRLTGSGVAMNDICITARTKKLVADYIAQLTKSGIRAYEIKRNKSDDRNYDGVRVATMHRVKGLEFQYVFVAAVNQRIVPLYSAISHTDAVAEQESLNAEKCLLYVALTRAQKGAYVTSYGKASEFLNC